MYLNFQQNLVNRSVITVYKNLFTKKIANCINLQLPIVTFFFEKKIYFQKTNLQKKSYIQYRTHYIQKKRNKGKKRLKILKEGRKRNGG